MIHGEYIKGRGAQFNTPNKYNQLNFAKDRTEAIDDWEESDPKTKFMEVQAGTIVNKVWSPDVCMEYSMNPYLGCEHGCAYCYARNTFEYWGYSAGLDFETKIMVKKNAPELLRKFLSNPKWVCRPISMSGNTDCYQPCERRFGMTRKLLEICNEFSQPVSIITKNAGILRDKDILKDMASRNLVSVITTITTLDPELRRLMEPRTATASQRFRVINELSQSGVKCGVMMGPVIPGLNDHEMMGIFRQAAQNGATYCAYTFIRLNGAVEAIFRDWLVKNYPDRAQKVWHLIEQGHGGRVGDSRWGVRMKGEGVMAQLISQQYHKFAKILGLDCKGPALETGLFSRPGMQLSLF